jgi:hypothetical protein
MSRISIIFLFALLSTRPVSGQRLEIQTFGGISTYWGDLSEKWMNPSTVHGAFALHGEIHPSDRWAFNAGLRKARISGDDALSTDTSLQLRNLHFKSDIYELQATARWYPVGYSPEDGRLHPYAFTGLSIFHFNPQANLEGEWYDLQPLGTEGQGTSEFPRRTPYMLTQFAIPMGAGLKFSIGSWVSVGVECMVQVAFTDYLDDVSLSYVNPNILISENGMLSYQLSNRTGEYLNSEPLNLGSGSKRGNTAVSDYYGYFGATVGVLLPEYFLPSRADKRYKIGCTKVS